MTNNKKLDPESEAALEVVNMGKCIEEKQSEFIKKVHSVALYMGQAQAFDGMALMSEFLKYKAMQKVADNREVLEKMGFSTIEDYFEAAGIGRRTGYNNLKIARTFSVEEVQSFALIGLTKKDLLGIAGLPPDKRPKIIDGKLENYDNADPEELKEIVESLVVENKAKDRLVEQKQQSFDASIKREAVLQEEFEKIKANLEKELNDLKNPKIYTSEEEKYFDLIKDFGMKFELMRVDMRSKLRYQKGPQCEAPQSALKQLFYLLLYIQKETREERLLLAEAYDGATDDIPWEPMDFELGTEDEMRANVPHLADVDRKIKALAEKKAKK